MSGPPAVKRRHLRRLLRLLGRLAARAPRLAFSIGDAIGYASAPFRGYKPRQLQAIFPELSAAEASRLLRRMLAMEVRNQMLASLTRSELARISRVDRRVESLERPVVVVTFHMGPMLAVGQFVSAADDEHHVVRAYGREVQGARQFHRALTTLKSGGIAAVVLDPWRGSMLDVPFFDTTMPVARGAFALSRLSGAPIVPVLFVWRGFEIDVVLGDRLPPPERGSSQDESQQSELRTATEAVRWLERHLRGSLQDIGLRVIWTPPKR